MMFVQSDCDLVIVLGEGEGDSNPTQVEHKCCYIIGFH